MKKTIHRYIVVLLCMLFLFTLPACTNTKDLNPTASELLKVAATELGLNEGFGEEVNCRYKKGEWTAEEAVSTWIS